MRLSWFPTDDRQQRARFRRYLIAAGTSLMVVALLGIAFLQGILSAYPFVIASGGTLAGIAAFYAVFRTGLNRRARDPSLTIPMMIAATCVVTYALYHAGPARSVFLLIYPMIMFFGVFRLNTRAMLIVCALILCAYALVLGLLMRLPSGLDAPNVELLRSVVLAAVLVWFAILGGYVHELRNRLRRSEYDELTGIFSRRRILEILAHEKTRCDRGAGPLCICLADIDWFKRINDSFGHSAGDGVLRTFTNIARGELRSIDFMGRYGGDEFLLVLIQTSLAGARECAERVRRQMELLDPPGLDGDGRVTVSIGLAQYRPGETLDSTFKRADASLYRAKDTGRNRTECEQSD
jgi:diguanylate cyclase (GGDEF)-like protein